MDRQARIIDICPSEKSPCWLRFRAQGLAGHASVPHGKNALGRLVKALARLEAIERRVVLTPAIEAMLCTLAQRERIGHIHPNP